MGTGQSGLDLFDRGRTALNLAAAHLGELLAELSPFVTGARVLDVEALPPRDLVFILEPASDAARETRRAPLRLLVSADADAPRIYLQAQRPARHEGPLGPFFRRAQQELRGLQLLRITQVAGDRIIAIEFGAAHAVERRALFAELVGRHANLLLLGPGERLLDWLVAPPPVRAEKAARLALGEPWVAPPGRPGKPEDAPKLGELLAAPQEPPPQLLPGLSAPLSWRIERSLGAQLSQLARERKLRDLRERLERRLARARSLVHGLEQRLTAAAGATRVMQDGELLKANLGRIQRGAKLIELEDWFVDPPVQRFVALDPKRSPQENLNAIFERFHKLQRSAADVEQELARANDKQAAFVAYLARLELPESDPDAIEAEATEAGWLEAAQVADVRKRKQAAPRKAYREYRALHGGAILVGRSAADNDELTLRIARGNDLWLHTRDAPGSHVVLRLKRDAEPDPEEVLDAATLAVHFSPLSESHKAAVHVARRKQVHKPRGAKPGLVALSGGKTLEVRMQPERVRRLLSTARSHAGSPDGPPPA
jgi:predicted ribosome quality control (RQC) complex YloA/Tae2 family protein